MKSSVKLSLLFILFTLTSFSQGSETSLSFDGINDYVEIPHNAIFSDFATSGVLTIEAWVKVNAINTDTHGQTRQPIVIKGNATDGWQWGLYITDDLRVGSSFWRDCGGSSHNEVTSAADTIIIGEWTHVAMVYNNGLFNRVYINGVLRAEKTTFEGSPCNGSANVFIAKREDDQFLNAEIDEIRFWSEVRTETQLRDSMCKKLIGNETNLFAYYQFNNGTGTTLTDLTSNGFDGTLNDLDSTLTWNISGAAIGDTSLYNYPADWAGINISLTSVDKGNFEVNTVTGTPAGIHIYRVDQSPNSSDGITNTINNNDVYYGVFVVEGSSPTYSSNYEYTNYTDAFSSKLDLQLYERAGNTVTNWGNTIANNDIITSTLSKDNITLKNDEFIIGGYLTGYKGPGGVGNPDGNSNIVLWMNPDKGANNNTNFTDQSGYGFDFTNGNGAIFNTNNINGNNSYSFDGTSNYFELPYQAILNPNTLSIFSTNNVTNSAHYKAVYSTRDTGTKGAILYARPDTDYWSFWTGSDGNAWDTIGNDTSTASSWATQTAIYNTTTNGKKFYINNQLNEEKTELMTPNTINPFRIGAGYNEGNPDYFFLGEIGEIVMYKAVVNTAQRIIINNYLSAKYNFSISINNYFTQDDNGDFDYDVAGIGQALDGTNHLDSQGTSIVRINTPSDLNNDEYLFWGRNSKDSPYNFTTTADYMERMDNLWRISKQNDLGTVSVHVAESDLIGKTSCGNLKLIISNVSDFSSKTTYDMLLSGGIYTATNVNFSDGDYFTFEYLDKIIVDGTSFYNGSGTNNVPDITDGCYKLLVKSSADGSLALTENAHVREVEVETGGKLVVNDGFNIEIDNAILNNGDIRLLGNAQLVQTHTGTSNVTGNGKLYMDRNSNLTNVYQSSFWSSPVSTDGIVFNIVDIMKDGSTPTTKDTTPPDINFIAGYDGANTAPISIARYWLAKFVNGAPTDPWDRHGDETTSYNITEGFNMKSTGGTNPNYTFVGKVNDGDYTSAITNGNSSLIGNPYPSAMDANVFLANNSSIFDTLHFWDSSNDTGLTTHVRGDYTGGFATYKSNTGVGYNGGTAPTQYIPVGQAFFVDAIGTGNIVFNNSQRVANTTGISFRSARIPLIRLGLSFTYGTNKSFHRQLAVSFRNSSYNFDSRYDAKVSYMRPTDMAIKALDTSDDYVIKALADFSNDLEIHLHVVLDEQRDLTFMIDGVENVNIDDVYLKDLDTNLYYNLENPISINIEAGDYSDRFVIVFRNSIANIEEITNNNIITVFDTIETIDINSNLVIKEVSIFNTLGQLVALQKANSTQVQMHIQNKKGQVLFVKTILENGQTQTKKLIKK